MITNKQVTIRFPREDEHIFNFLKRFERKALKENWTRDEVNSVLDKAFCYSYHYILDTLLDHCLFSEKVLTN